MDGRPGYPRPHLPAGPAAALIAAETAAGLVLPRALRRGRAATTSGPTSTSSPRDEIEAFLARSAVTLYTLMRAGWPHGFFVLDGREAGRCDLA